MTCLAWDHTVDLVAALEDRQIGIAALDMTDPEPLPPDHPLLACDNVLVTPYVAWYSEPSLGDLQRIATKNVTGALRGDVAANLLNRDVIHRSRRSHPEETA